MVVAGDFMTCEVSIISDGVRGSVEPSPRLQPQICASGGGLFGWFGYWFYFKESAP